MVSTQAKMAPGGGSGQARESTSIDFSRPGYTTSAGPAGPSPDAVWPGRGACLAIRSRTACTNPRSSRITSGPTARADGNRDHRPAAASGRQRGDPPTPPAEPPDAGHHGAEVDVGDERVHLLAPSTRPTR